VEDTVDEVFSSVKSFVSMKKTNAERRVQYEKIRFFVASQYCSTRCNRDKGAERLEEMKEAIEERLIEEGKLDAV
jgi:hypothetical protein